MHFRSSARQAGGKRPPCVATPTTAVVGSYPSASSIVPTTGTPLIVSPALVESRTATVGCGEYARMPRAVFP